MSSNDIVTAWPDKVLDVEAEVDTLKMFIRGACYEGLYYFGVESNEEDHVELVNEFVDQLLDLDHVTTIATYSSLLLILCSHLSSALRSLNDKEFELYDMYIKEHRCHALEFGRYEKQVLFDPRPTDLATTLDIVCEMIVFRRWASIEEQRVGWI